MYLIKVLVDKIILDPSVKVAEVIPVYCSKIDIFHTVCFEQWLSVWNGNQLKSKAINHTKWNRLSEYCLVKTNLTWSRYVLTVPVGACWGNIIVRKIAGFREMDREILSKHGLHENRSFSAWPWCKVLVSWDKSIKGEKSRGLQHLFISITHEFYFFFLNSGWKSFSLLNRKLRGNNIDMFS